MRSAPRTSEAPLPSLALVVGPDGMVYTPSLDASENPTGDYYQIAYGRVKDVAVTRFGTGQSDEALVIGTDNQVYDESIVGTAKSDDFATAYGAVASVSVGTDAGGNPLRLAAGTDDLLYEHKSNARGKAASPSDTRAAYGDFAPAVLTYRAGGNPLLYAQVQDGRVYGQKVTATGTPAGPVIELNHGPVKRLVAEPRRR